MSGTYSFLTSLCTIQGPGLGSVSLSDGGVAAEGIDWEMEGDKNLMVKGAAGDVMHNLAASKAGRFTIRLLKTSPVNQLLSQGYNVQAADATLWGNNVITLHNNVLLDTVTGIQCAYRKLPNLKYAIEGGMNEWQFDVGQLTYVLGGGTLNAVAGIINTAGL